jgi:hypothetical protein
MDIALTHSEIVSLLPKVKPGLDKYLWLQSKIEGGGNFHSDSEFRRRFNGFYRVRRGSTWQESFYGLMARAKDWPFSTVLAELSAVTGRVEASFSSKLCASLNPLLPVIDSFVLKNVGLKLPSIGSKDRARKVCEVYESLRQRYCTFLGSDNGRALVHEFRRYYPTVSITELKMVDLVLWQKRG